MDGISSDTNENDNIERKPVTRRYSSILKPPRSPLQDLRGGNETVQESNVLRNRKSSRRVSFADTIKVFQTEPHMTTVRKGEIAETKTGENILDIQNKNPDDNNCEISGMDTLLCAPIQMQPKELLIIEHKNETKHANDQTVIFSDENQMDLTASHTVMITKGLSDCLKSDKSTKIDTTSFLANLKHHAENSTMKTALKCSMSQNSSSEKKINCNDFIKRLKTGKYIASSTGPDKENSEMPIYPKESNSASSIYQMDVSPNVDENSSNRTRIFSEQDDRMNFTQCHTGSIQTFVLPFNEANSGEFKGDTTIYSNECMDLTANHVMQVLPSARNISETKNQTQSLMMDITTGCGAKEKKTVLKDKLNAVFQDSFLNPQHKIYLTKSHIMGSETHTITQTSEHDARTLAMTSESLCSSPTIQGYKTVFYSSCNDAMELTKCLEKNLLNHDSNYSKMCTNPDTSPLLTEKTIYSGEDSMDITKSHTVAIDNIFEQDQSNTEKEKALQISEKEAMLQNHITAPEDEKMNVNHSLALRVSKERSPQSPVNSLSISLINKRNKLLSSEGMDLTESHTSNLRNQAPLISYDVAPETITTSYSYSKNPSDEWKKMTQSLIQLSQQPDFISENILTDPQGKEKHQILKISSCFDKDPPQPVHYHQGTATIHTRTCCDDLDKQVALGHTEQGHHSKLPEPQNKISNETVLACFHDRIICSEKEQTMDLTRSHTAVIGVGLPQVQECSKTNLECRTSQKEQTMDLTRSHTAVIGVGLPQAQECSKTNLECRTSQKEQTMDLTRSHTAVIGVGLPHVQEHSKTNLECRTSQLTTVSRQFADKSPIGKTGAIVTSDMSELEDRSIQKPGFLKTKQNVKIFGRKSVGGLKIDKTIIFSEGNENDMDITKSHTVEINHRPLLGKQESNLVSLAETSKAVSYTCGQDEKEFTRSHTTALACGTISPDEKTTRPLDKTVMFIDNHDELEMTKSHTVFIDYQEAGKTVLEDRPNFELYKRKSLQEPKGASAPAMQSASSSENDESHHPTAKGSQLTVLEEWSNNVLIKEAVTIIADDNAEGSKLTTRKHVKDVQKPGFLNEFLPGKSQRCSLRLRNDRTIVFSENDNDMDITQSSMVGINKTILEDRKGFNLVPLAETSKAVSYTCGQDGMEFTKSHTAASECRTVSPDEKTTRPLDKTVMFIDNHDELEMTKSHTVFIDYQEAGKTVLEDRPNFELYKRKSLQEPKGASAPAMQSASSSENDESHHPTAKGSQLTVLEEWSNNVLIKEAVTIIADDNAEGSKLTTRKHVKDVQKPGFLNEFLPGKSQRCSLRLRNDRTIVFSENDNDMDITQSSMVGINKITLEDREGFNLVPLAETSKAVSYTCGQDGIEFTKSHTAASECRTVSPDEKTTRPLDKTVMFVDNHNDLEVTKSHTVFIDCQATGVLHEYPKFEIAQEITEKEAAAEQKHLITTLNPTNTLSSDQNKMEIIKFHRTDTEADFIRKNQASVLEEAKIESCLLNSINRRNVNITNSHTAAVCGSSDNGSYLPNATSFDNLECNVIFLGDNNEKANNCQVQNKLLNADDLASGYCVESERMHFFAPCPLKEEVIQTKSKGHLDCAIALLKDQDLIKESQNQTLAYSQILEEMTKVNKFESFKLPNKQVKAFVDDFCVASQPHLSTQQLQPLTQQGQSIVNKDEAILSKAGKKTSNFLLENSSAPICESKLLSAEKHLIVSCKKLKESSQTANCNTDCSRNSDLTTQVIQTHINDKEASEAIVPSNVPCFSIVKSSLGGKTEEFLDFQTVRELLSPEQLLELENKTHVNNMNIVQAVERHNIVSTDAKINRSEETLSHNGAGSATEPTKTVSKDKMRCSLGIFLPRLPNKRNCSVTGIDDIEQIPADLNHSETQQVCGRDSGVVSVVAKLDLSPSQYINEENLPIYPDEINSLDSISTEIEEKALIDRSHKEILPFENNKEETCSAPKRTWVQEEDGPTEKKVRKYDTSQDQEVFDHHTEKDIDKNVNDVLIRSPSRTPSSCHSSLDSIKADGTPLDLSTQRNSQMESQFLDDIIGEENLREKLKDGRITIREFFILLQVHILIQKPRQSTLSARCTINTSSTPEDLMLRQYVYGPKIDIYREDCEVLRQKIEELKVSSLNQEKLLTHVNRNLWEKMRHCSDEELKTFGIYLNKIKSRYTKMTKVFTHQGKVALYSKLVHSAQNEKEKLQIRINEMDSILKKMNNYLTEMEIETNNLENEEKHNSVEEWDSKIRIAEKELGQLKTEEEALQRKLLEVVVQKENTLAQIEIMQKQINETEELLDQVSVSEWDVIEWSDDQAVFTFVYDSIELTIIFGEPVVGLPFLDNKACRMIADLRFQSLLDEDKAPPSSILVHKLIFQYIEKQESWRKKCTTQHQVPQMLQELSLVVSHCRLLGQNIEFLKSWGPRYNLMDVDINNTELKLLFSSYAAFAKFELTLSLSADYLSSPLPFTIQNRIGNIGHNEIASIISKVPFKDNYLKNIVKQIYQDLLTDCHFSH